MELIEKFIRAIKGAWSLVLIAPETMLTLLGATTAVTALVVWKVRDHQVQNARSERDSAKAATETADKLVAYWKTKFDGEKEVHEALKKQVSEKDKISKIEVEARAIADAPKTRLFITGIMTDGVVETSVNPADPPEKWAIAALAQLTLPEMQKIAYASNTASSGITTSASGASYGFVTRIPKDSPAFTFVVQSADTKK